MRTTAPLNQSWLIAAFAVIGAFALCGLGGAVIAEAFGIWSTPVAGFTAAFAVVAVAYLATPNFQRQSTILVFAVGCLAAWGLLGDLVYPGTYETTPLPFLITVAGGVIALIICVTPSHRHSDAKSET